MPNPQICDKGYDSEVPLRMLRLKAEAIADNWPVLRGPIEVSLPPLTVPTESYNRMTNILGCLLAGTLECHIFFKVIKGETFVYGLTVLAVGRNIEDTGDHMLIYAAWGHTKYLFENGLMQCLGLIRKYAYGRGCKAIITYSANPFVIRCIKEAGGNADYRLLTLEV